MEKVLVGNGMTSFLVSLFRVRAMVSFGDDPPSCTIPSLLSKLCCINVRSKVSEN
jgi:hypothetical protein